jgi:hypothetical protein
MDRAGASQKAILFVLVAVFLFTLQNVIVKGNRWRLCCTPNRLCPQSRSTCAAFSACLAGGQSGPAAHPPARARPGESLRHVHILHLLLPGPGNTLIGGHGGLVFIAPLFVTTLSVPLLGERVGARRWAAIAVGFLGVLVMLRPGTSAAEPAALLPILAALSYALAAVLTRRLGGTISGSSKAFYAMAFYVVASAAAGAATGTAGFTGTSSSATLDFLVHPWVIPPWPDLGLMPCAGWSPGWASSLSLRPTGWLKASR